MNYITTTQLRTRTTDLLSALHDGQTIDLIHRSQVVGEIRQKQTRSKKTIDSKKLQRIIDELDLPRLTSKEIDRRYRIAMIKKHGQGIH